MRLKVRQWTTIAAALCVVSGFSNPAAASVVMNVNQDGGNVVITATGNLNLDGLSVQGYYVQPGLSDPGGGFIQVGPTGDAVTGYLGFSSSTTSFGLGGATYASTASGSNFDVNAGAFATPVVFVANDYVSGSPIDGSETFYGATLDSLGYTAGQYVFTSSGDTVTVNIGDVAGASAVPELATWAMMILGMGAVGFTMRRSKATTRVFYAA